MNTPKVSILIPCYNSEGFIAETLKSCVSQTYTNIEIIVVDDGSTDNSVALVKEWSYKYDNINLYIESNSGACHARNIAFRKSTGDYILYLDADDLIASNYIELLVTEIIKLDNLSLVTGEWDRFRQSIEEAKFPFYKIYKNYKLAFDLLIDMWNYGEMFACSSYLIPRNLVNIVGDWDENILKNQDGEFFCRILIAANQVIHVNSAKFYYRTGDYLSVSKSDSKEKVSSMLETFICYRRNAMKFEDSLRVRRSLSINFTLFMYIYGYKYKDLYEKAKMEIKELGLGYILKNEPFRVRLICKIVGFENFIKFRFSLFSR